MDELPLQRFEYYHTTRVDESRDKTARLMRSHRLVPLGRSSEGFEARHHVAPVGSASVHYVGYGWGDTRVVPRPLETFYVLMIPHNGRCVVNVADQSLDISPGTAALISPSDNLDMVWEGGCGQLMVKLPTDIVTRRLESLLHRPVQAPPRFETRIDLRAEPSRQIHDLVLSITEALSAGSSLLTHQGMLTSVEQVLTTAPLYAQPHDHVNEMTVGHAAAGAHTVRRVVEFIEESRTLPGTITELVAVAGVSERSLQRTFREQLGMSPMRYVSEAWLRRVHDELVKSGCESGVTVTQIAARAGVSNLGRFARSYRERYGELPSDTKRRAQAGPWRNTDKNLSPDE